MTWTLLIGGLIARSAGLGGLGVTIGGSIHGFVFLLYGASVILVGINQRWRLGAIVVGIVSAIVPYATIPFDIVMDRRGALAGPWRLTETDNPADRRWYDRTMRWFLNRPVVLIGAGIVVLVLIFVVLLVVGPPGGSK